MNLLHKLARIFVIPLICLVYVPVALSGASSPPKDLQSCTELDPTHEAWTAILIKYVKDSGVNYLGLQQEGQDDLKRYLSHLSRVCINDYQKWTDEMKIAFWINAYNAFTFRLILDHYPLKSIRSIGLLPGSVFRKSFISLPQLHVGKLSLDDIEHEILRKKFTDPRIHFALVCASTSCPELRQEAYRGEILNPQLEEATTKFVRDRKKNRFDQASRTLYLSSIFSWFQKDFEKGGKTLKEFAATYLDPVIATKVLSSDVKILFLDYDWYLNEARL